MKELLLDSPYRLRGRVLQRCSHGQRRQPGPASRFSGPQARTLVERCKQAQSAGHSVGVSAITVSELEYGAQRSDRYETEIEAMRKVLLPFDLYDYDAVGCAEHYGRIRYELEASGATIGALDLLIAAHVLSLNGAVVTNNEGHFRRVSQLIVENWAKPRLDSLRKSECHQDSADRFRV